MQSVVLWIQAALAFTEVQLLFIAMAANVIVWIVRFLLSKVGYIPAREVLVGFIYIVSAVLAVAFSEFALPSGGLESWLSWLTVAIAPFVALTWAIYQLIGKRVFDAIDKRVPALSFR